MHGRAASQDLNVVYRLLKVQLYIWLSHQLHIVIVSHRTDKFSVAL